MTLTGCFPTARHSGCARNTVCQKARCKKGLITERRRQSRLPVVLSPQAEAGDESSVSLDILIAQVSQQPPPLTNHHQKPSPTVVILLMGPQVLGEVIDSFGQQRDLDLGRTRVLLVRAELFYKG